MSLKIEAGRYYRLRNGEKAFVAAVMLDNPEGHSSEYPVRGYCGPSMSSWASDGFIDCRSCPRDHDIVAEWVDPPKKHKVWVNFHRDSGGAYGGMHLSRSDADHFASANRIACIEIEFTEGEGL